MNEEDRQLIGDAIAAGKLGYSRDDDSWIWSIMVSRDIWLDSDIPMSIFSVGELSVDELEDYTLNAFEQLLNDDENAYDEALTALQERMELNDEDDDVWD
jgi:hypothetical protein